VNDDIRVLIVEDDPAMARGLVDNLIAEGYRTRHVVRGEGIEEEIAAFEPQLIVLDIMLPGRSGLDTLRALRQHGYHHPVLILSARGEVVDRVVGLELGADDYLPKPFALEELRARIKALLRRSSEAACPARTLELAGIHFDFAAAAAVDSNGEPVDLCVRDIQVLRILYEARGAAVDRWDIVDALRGPDSDATSRTVDNHVVALRRALGDDPRRPRHIRTVRGIGYRLVVD
jgi:DNA-binding response OmpR family regulator